MIKAYIYFKKTHSEKYKRDYLNSYLVVGSDQNLINIPKYQQMLFLNLGARELEALEVGFESQHFNINLGE